MTPREWVLAAVAPLIIFFPTGCQRNGPPSANSPGLPIIKTKGGLEMVLIPAGTFSMGNRRGKEDETFVHTVSLDAFLMDRYEVTQAEFERHQLSDPSQFKGPTLPVDQVTWRQAAMYCIERSRAEGLEPCYHEDNARCDFRANGYRLPTEAEWEYACRAGTNTDYSFGNDPRALADFAWFGENSSGQTHPVGQKKPNPWGLFDMHGNAIEWCNDIYDRDYYSQSPAANPRGPAEGTKYLLRGGAWRSPAASLRSSYRLAGNPGFADTCPAGEPIGFRCVKKNLEKEKD